MTQALEPFYVVDKPLGLGEAPIYRATDSTLHFVDCNSNQLLILSIDPSTTDPVYPSTLSPDDASTQNPENKSKTGLKILDLADSVSCHVFRKNHPGSYIVLYYQGFAFLDENTGKMDVLKEIIPTNERHLRRFNDGGVDPSGRFWGGEIDKTAASYGAGGLPEDYGTPVGRLWRYDPDGTLTEIDTGYICANGLVWSPNKKEMFVNDSVGQKVYRYDYDDASGTISNRTVIKDFKGTKCEPDGCVVDKDGNLWMALWGGYNVIQMDRTGKILQDIKFTASNMTCPTWGGEKLDTLFVTSAYEGEKGDHGGQLFKFKTNTNGALKYEFAG